MTVFDPPQDVFVIGYIWRRGGATSGERQVCISRGETLRTLTHLIDEKKIHPEAGDFTVWRLDPLGQWIKQDVIWPTSVDLRDQEEDGH